MRGYHPSFMEIIRLLKPSTPMSISRLCTIIRVMINPDLVRYKSSTMMRLRRAMLVIITLALVAFVWLILDTFNLILSNLVPMLADAVETDPYGDAAKFISGLEMLLLPLSAVLFSFSSLLAFRRSTILNSLNLGAMFMAAPVFRTAEQILQEDAKQFAECLSIGCLQMDGHAPECRQFISQQKFDELLRTATIAPRYTQDGMVLPIDRAKIEWPMTPDDDKRQRYEKEKGDFERYNSTVIQVTLVSSASCLVPLAIQAAIAAGYGVLFGIQSLFF